MGRLLFYRGDNENIERKEMGIVGKGAKLEEDIWVANEIWVERLE